jgi:hypothetical protein
MTEDKLTREEVTAMVRAAAQAGRIMYQCCFCHGEMPAAEASAVIVVTRWAHPQDEQAEQQWFCHLSCFEQATGEMFEAEPDQEEDAHDT